MVPIDVSSETTTETTTKTTITAAATHLVVPQLSPMMRMTNNVYRRSKWYNNVQVRNKVTIIGTSSHDDGDDESRSLADDDGSGNVSTSSSSSSSSSSDDDDVSTNERDEFSDTSDESENESNGSAEGSNNQRVQGVTPLSSLSSSSSSLVLPISFTDISRAEVAIRGGVVRTSCEKSHFISELVGANVYFKNEFRQFTGSFKERGARYAILQLIRNSNNNNNNNNTNSKNSTSTPLRGVIAASAGNHALALAYHGQKLNIPVTVVMPTTAPLAKVDKCRVSNLNLFMTRRNACLYCAIPLLGITVVFAVCFE
jgi:Pyridoxal-phosphate dependent enzyme